MLRIAIACSFGGLGFAACERAESPTEETPTSPETPETPETPEATAEVEEVADEPQSFYGKTVSLSGEVDEVFSDRAFELEGNDWIGDEEVLVVTRQPVMLGQGGPQDDDDLIVTGKVQRQTIAEIEREIGWDLDPEIEIEYENRPILVAESIRQTGDIATWSADQEPEGVIVSTWTLHEAPDPSALEGRKVNLTAIPVQAKAGDGLWIGSSHQSQTFVALPEGFDAQSIEVGDQVDLQGEFQKMPPVQEAMNQWKFDDTLRAQVAEEVLYVDASQITKAQPQPEEPEKQASAQQAGQQQPGVAFEAQGGLLTPEGELVTLEKFATSPVEYTGQAVQGEARVLEVPSDRGFWLEMPEGNKVFAVIHEEDPEHKRIDINPGNTVKFTGIALSPDKASELPLPLEDASKQALKGQDAFIAVHWKNIQKVEGKTQKSQQGQTPPDAD